MTASRAMPLPGHTGLWYASLDEHLAEALILRTLDPADVRLREMTRDLTRFSSQGQLAQWRPGRDLLCLHDDERSLLGVFWIAAKPMPARSDYFDPAQLRERDPRITCAMRTYGVARGRGKLAWSFADCALRTLLERFPETPSVWYETKAHNAAARALARQMGCVEVSGEEGGTVVGVRFARRTG